MEILIVFIMVQASPAKKYMPSRPVVSFCTALIIEVLGTASTFDSDAVKRILPFVTTGIQPGMRGGGDHKVRLKVQFF